MPLEKYRRKRSPERTPEPFGGVGAGTSASGLFVIQKHAARRLHYDFRLEMEGVLRSWAIPKGPSLNPADKRLAVMVEDHPLDYANFEGVIPQDNYGAGAVIVWDRGEYRALDPPENAAAAIRAGKLDLELRGYKLGGAFTLVRTRGRPERRSDKENWLLIKKRDAHANDADVLAAHPRSVLSGLTLEETREGADGAARIAQELERIGAPALKAAMAAKSFPLSLATLAAHPPEGSQWLYELKYDGVRALGIRDGARVWIFGRSRADFTAHYPEVALALASMPYERFAIDGEIVAHGADGRPSFQMLQHRIQAHDAREVARLALSTPVFYQVFDLLAFGGLDLRPLPLERRKEMLAQMVRGEGAVRYTDHYDGRGADLMAATAAAGLEGIVAKRRDSPYRGTRATDWLKIKSARTARFVVGGWTAPAGSRTHFGALLLGQYEADGLLRFVSRVGSGFDAAKLASIHRLIGAHAQSSSPFRRPRGGEPAPPRGSHFCAPALVCEVRFSEWTNDGGLRHPVYLKLIEDANPAGCVYEGPAEAAPAPAAPARTANPRRAPRAAARNFELTNPDKIFWPAQGYTKRDLVEYYREVAPLMLPYLRDRPVVLTRYPDGIGGKSFFQKDAPGFAPSWIRRATIYSEDAHRDISYFVLESAEAIAYMANLGAIPIHIWSSRLSHPERPDWLLFDIDPKGTTTARAVTVALEVGEVLRSAGLRPCVKTSGQKGLHVVVGLKPLYTYEHARMFAELVARLVVRRIPLAATIARDIRARGDRAYIDYLQLGRGKTIAAPFAVRPVDGAPVSAPLLWSELGENLDPRAFNIRTMSARMARLGRDPFLAALEDRQSLRAALDPLERALNAGASDAKARA